MKKLNKRELIILVICIVLVIVFMAYKFVITPMNENNGDIQDNISMNQLKLQKYQKLIRSSTTLDGKYKKLVDILGIAQSEGVEFSQIVSTMESIARSSNVHVANVQPQKAYNKESTRVFPVEIDIDGAWGDIVKFLYIVQDKPNFFNVDEMNLEKYSDTASSLRGRIVLSRIRVIPAN